MPTIRTGYSCPSCKRASGDTNEIVAEGRLLKCSKVPEHQWNDLQTFIDLKPKIEFQQEQAKAAPQAGHVPMTVTLPPRIKNAIQSKYGDKADATVAGVLSMLAEGEVLVIGEIDLQRIASILRERPKNGSHLFGMLVALSEEIKEAKVNSEAAAKDVQAYQGLSVGRVLIDLGSQFQNATQRAQAENLPTGEFVRRAVVNGLENNWF